MPKTLRAFHNNPTIQRKYVGRAFLGYELDQFRQGFYLERGDKRADDRFCAVGCILQDRADAGDRAQYETLLGIPEPLAHLQDRIFETLSDEDAKTWAVAFMQAIPLGADLSDVARQFALWLLTNEGFGPVHHLREADRESAGVVLCQILNSGTPAYDDGGIYAAMRSLQETALHGRTDKERYAADRVAGVGRAFQFGDGQAPDADILREALTTVIGDQYSPGDPSYVNACASELLRLLADAPVPAEVGV